MSRIKFYLALIAIFILQLSFVNLISIRGYRPDLILVFLLFNFSAKGGMKPTVAGFIIGLAQDLIGGGFIGINSLAKTSAGFILGKMFPKKTPGEWWLFYPGLMICIFVHDFIYHYIMGSVEHLGFLSFLWFRVLPSTAYNFCLCFIVGLMSFVKSGK